MNIRADVLAAIEAHGRRVAPNECCGLLLGSDDAVTAAVATPNVSPEPQRHYTIDPKDHFRVVREGRVRGLDVVGAYHSHPGSAPVPSETDRREALEDFLFVIVGFAGSAVEIRAWRFESGNFAAVPIVRLP